MNPIKNRIDFVAIISVNGANPNGDPLSENIPRMDSLGFGEISDVCIKHKIRNRLAAIAKENGSASSGNDVLIVSADAGSGRAACISDKLAPYSKVPNDEKADAICNAFRDVRSFGFLWAAKGGDETKGGLSIGIRGPVTVQTAKSVDRITPDSMQITKCISMDNKNGKRGSDTMGMKHHVDRAAYVIFGTCNAYLSEKTGFSDEDAEALKEALKTLFFCDESAARPAGTMEVNELFWGERPSKMGSISSGAVFRSFDVTPKDEFPFYSVTIDQKKLDDADIKVEHWLA